MHYHYYRSHVLLVINGNGAIRQLYTPFRVQSIATNAWMYVDEVLATEKDELIFMVHNQPYPHHYFRIMIQF